MYFCNGLIKTVSKMYKNEDFERFFLRYKAEAYTAGESIQSFCIKNNVPYNLFEKWYRDTRHHIVPVKVDGTPKETSTVSAPEKEHVTSIQKKSHIRILVDIHVSNGLHVSRKNLSYGDLKSFVEKLEALC